MKTIIHLFGTPCSGKSFVLRLLKKQGFINIIITNNISRYINDFNKLKVDSSKRKECFSTVSLSDDNFNFYNKIITYSKYDIILTKNNKWFRNNRIDKNFNIIRLSIIRDPRISWLLSDEYNSAEKFCYEYSRVFNYIKNDKFYKFENIIKNYKSILLDIFKSYPYIKLDEAKLIIPPIIFNKYLTKQDSIDASNEIQKNKGQYMRDFKIIEKKLKSEIIDLDYEPSLKIDNILIV
jgi:hypothetical protein